MEYEIHEERSKSQGLELTCFGGFGAKVESICWNCDSWGEVHRQFLIKNVSENKLDIWIFSSMGLSFQ
jgi:hypothetical protein